MSKFWVHTSIVLETVSFLLVTLDLYGAERIKNAEMQLRKISTALLTDKSKKIFVRVSLAISVMFTITVGVYVGVKLSSFKDAKGNTDGILGIIFMSAVFAYSGKILKAITHFLLSTLINITQFSYRMLHRFSLEGVMIVIGLILFIVSKFISYIIS